MALLVTAGVGFLQAAILFGRKAPLLVSLYANSGVETRLAVYGFLANFGARRFPKGERKALWCARRRIPLAMVGKDAPTTAREWDLPSHGALTLFFRWRKKSAQKKASGTATTKTAHVAAHRGLRPAVAPSGLSSASARCAHPPEKGFDCPFCRRGSQCRAQWSWIAITYVWSALVLAFFRRQNGRAFFPPLPIAALFPRRWRWADSNSGAWDASMRLGWLRSTEKQD